MEDGVFPHQRSLGEVAQLAEERRLAYVGITRARERLYLSRAQMRSAWGQPAYNPASRFLDEIPSDLVRWERSGTSLGGSRSSSGGGYGGYGSGISNAPVARLSGPAPTSGTRARAVLQLAPGDKVTHDSFGLGTVVEIEGAGDRAIAHVDFRADGVKRLLLRYAPLTKL
jgi:DNA helicase-2/ATP-dependent DNA helicase PcrA